MDSSRNAAHDQLQHAAAYGRTGIAYSGDVFALRLGNRSVSTQWTAYQGGAL